jgi:hypothetical protein
MASLATRRCLAAALLVHQAGADVIDAVEGGAAIPQAPNFVEAYLASDEEAGSTRIPGIVAANLDQVTANQPFTTAFRDTGSWDTCSNCSTGFAPSRAQTPLLKGWPHSQCWRRSSTLLLKKMAALSSNKILASL